MRMKFILFNFFILALPVYADNSAEPQYQLNGGNYAQEAPNIQQMFYNVAGAIQTTNLKLSNLTSQPGPQGPPGVPGSGWSVSGANIYNNNSGNVGIKTINPGTQLDVLGPIRSLSTSFINPSAAKGLEYYYDATADQGVIDSNDRSSGLVRKPLEIQGTPLLLNTNGSTIYTINPTNTKFPAGYGILAPVLPEPGMVIMYATSLNTISGTDPWTVIYSTGGFVNTTGSTTRGLQEAINASAPSGIPLLIRCSGSTSVGGTQPFILATSQVNIPAVQGWRMEADNCNLSFSQSVSTDGFVIDSTEITDIYWQGQIVYQGLGAAVRFHSIHNLPIDGFIADDGSKYYFSNVVTQPPAGSTATAVVWIDPSAGSWITNRLELGELNGTSNTKYCVLVSTPGANTSFEDNYILIQNPHLCTNAGVQDGLSATNQANLRRNQWIGEGFRLNGNGYTGGPNGPVGFNTWGSNDNILLTDINNEEGTLSTGTVLNAGANENEVHVSSVTGQSGAAIVDNGANNLKFVDGQLLGITNFLGTARMLSTTILNPPSGKGLEVYYDSMVDQGVINPYDRGGSSYKQLTISGNPLYFSVNGTNKAILSGSGLGVNTITPATNLDVAGNAQFGSGVVKSTMTANGQFIPAIFTKSQIDTLVPDHLGAIIECSNCTDPFDICRSTGTLASQWRATENAGHGCGSNN